jgi:hypothetical protein
MQLSRRRVYFELASVERAVTNMNHVSMIFVLATLGGCAGSVSSPSIPAIHDGGSGSSGVDGATAGAGGKNDASSCAVPCGSGGSSAYAAQCPPASRAGATASIAACPSGPLAFGKPLPLLSAASLGGGVTFQAIHQNALVATRPAQGGVESFVVTFTLPTTAGGSVDTAAVELPAADRARTIVAIGPEPSSPTDPRLFEVLACGAADCAFFAASGGALALDPALPSLKKDAYRNVQCRQPGDTCELCVDGATARVCFVNGSFQSEPFPAADLGVCCPVASGDLRWAVPSDFRGLSRFAVTRSGDLLNDQAVSQNGGPCCLQGTGFADAVGFDVVTCGASNNPMILTASTLYGTASCVTSH